MARIKCLIACTVEENGEISGFTEVTMAPGRESLVSQGLTGVPMKYRGRKLGKWVKAGMLQYIASNYPLAKAVATGNADTNAPMLYINNKLGFKKHKESVLAQITLDTIESYLNSRKVKVTPLIQ